MTKAEELRINNLVIVNHKTDLISVVTWIQKDSVHVEFERQPDLVNGLIVSPKSLLPIPLTEEWLLRLGFALEQSDDKWREYRKGAIKFTAYSNGRIETFNADQNINHVHQLQNLHFALTGEELILKGG